MPIRDAALKATGQLKYVADMKFSGMLHAKVLFSPVAHARIKRIDTSKAEAVEGVFAVISYQNTPDVYFNSCGETIELFKTERLFDEIVRFVGDKVAAVAAVDENTRRFPPTSTRSGARKTTRMSSTPTAGWKKAISLKPYCKAAAMWTEPCKMPTWCSRTYTPTPPYTMALSRRTLPFPYSTRPES
jgi:xanthine dehydrogenase molybdopterin-binding subunit B